MSSIQDLHALGQSLWYDNIQRSLLTNGEMSRLIAAGDIRGVTSNPSIFNNAIAKTHDYDADLLPMAQAGLSPELIFNRLSVQDIQTTADLFLPLYRSTGGGDGYVSLEVSPYLAHDTAGTIAEAKRLWEQVSRPNLMVKIPATLEGIPAISQAIAAGLNINVTLIFSLERYGQVIEAYLSGLEQRVSQGFPIASIASVASFFVSRVDTKVDAQLEALISQKSANSSKVQALLGKAAIANARLAYQQFLSAFNSERFARLRQQGARKQRPLWASTSAKNPAYRDVVYVEELIGPDTVDTIPPQTLVAFRDHGNARISITEQIDQAKDSLAQLESIGIAMQTVTSELEAEGVKAFSDSMTSLLKTIEERRLSILAEKAR